MFRNEILTTPLTSDAANRFFCSKINGGDYRGDYSFLATLRAIVYPRMKDGEEAYIRFSDSDYGRGVLDGVISKRSVFNAICDDMIEENGFAGTIHIHNFRHSDPETNKAFMEFVEKNFLGEVKDWYRIDKVTDFYRKVLDVICFVHPSTRRVAMFCSGLNYRTMHYLQCGIPAYMPWYFNQEDGVTELEMELIESLRMKTHQKYVECMFKFAEQYDFETEKIKTLLKGFELQYERDEIDRLRGNINNYEVQIDNCLSRMAELAHEKRDMETKIIGLEERIRCGESENEVMDYFLANKKLFLDTVNGTRIKFAVKDFLSNFDSAEAEKSINREDSFWYYNNSRRSIANDDMKRFAKAVFVDQELKIQFCAAYVVDLNASGGSAISNYNFDSRFNDAMPNPHIQYHSCLGGYKSQIGEAIIRHDAIMAIAACVQSCRSLNVGEGATMDIFMDYLNTLNQKCVLLPDGSMTTVKGAIAFLKQREEQGNE